MFDHRLIVKILCVAFVAAVMMPVGRVLFPHISADLSGMQFNTIEAVVSATLGFGIYEFFG